MPDEQRAIRRSTAGEERYDDAASRHTPLVDHKLSEFRPALLALGIALAPVPAALVTLVLAMTIKDLSPKLMFIWAGVLFFTSVSWTMIVAIVYGLVVTAWRQRISHIECLVTGAVFGAFFPLAVIAFRHHGPRTVLHALHLPPRRTPLPPGVLDWATPSDYFIVASCLLFGILGGWIFWTIATGRASAARDVPVFE